MFTLKVFLTLLCIGLVFVYIGDRIDRRKNW